MADTLRLENLNRSHFASYDLIIYFGGGFFFFIISSYVVDYSFVIKPNVQNIFKDNVYISSVVEILFFGFVSYIIGHIVSYASDQIIQNTLISSFGYPLDWLDGKSDKSNPKRVDEVRKYIRSNIKNNLKINHPGSIVRFIFHIPVMWIYYFVFYRWTMDGFYRSRIPKFIYELTAEKLNKLIKNESFNGFKDGNFKFIEHISICSSASTMSKMYNYVIVYGLLRFLTFSVLVIIWYLYIDLLGYLNHLYQLDYEIYFSLNKSITNFKLLNMLIMTIVYISLLMSFGKFFRRYAEEAVFSFAVADIVRKSN